jgi:hypothetical protein
MLRFETDGERQHSALYGLKTDQRNNERRVKERVKETRCAILVMGLLEDYQAWAAFWSLFDK